MSPRSDHEPWVWQQNRFAPASALSMVSVHELQSLREALDRGLMPLDFQAKLAHLSGNDVTRHIIGQHCRLFVALLLGAQTGMFHPIPAAARERLLRVLAYVRKEDDAIPDYKTNGFADDLKEVRQASLELAPLLQEFKRWRLQHQVPGMWLGPLPRHTQMRQTKPGGMAQQERIAAFPFSQEAA